MWYFKFLIVLAISFSKILFAVDTVTCTNSFDQIDEECIQGYETKFAQLSIALEKLKNDQVIFYKTSENNLGKLKIIGTESSNGECSLYLESETFGNSTSYKTNTSRTIDNKIGLWSTKELNLDYKTGKSDFILKRKIENPDSDKPVESCRLEALGDSKLYMHSIMSDTKTVTGNRLIYIAALLLSGVAVYLLVFNFLKEEEKFSEDEKLSNQDGDGQSKITNRQGLIAKYSMPIVRKYLVETISKMKGIDKIKEKYKRPLANAGLLRIISPTEFYALKFFLVVAFPLLFLVLRWLFEIDVATDNIIFAVLAGYIYPEIWLKSLIAKRKEEMFLSMPFIVDMLALSIEAGLDFVAAIGRVIEKAPPSPLSDEFSTLIKEIKIGSSRGEALRQLSWRVDEISVNSFCATLIAADSVGASVGPVLKAISKELRNKRSSLIESKAAQASTKMMMAMMVLIVPAIIIIVLVPPAAEFFK